MQTAQFIPHGAIHWVSIMVARQIENKSAPGIALDFVNALDTLVVSLAWSP